MRILGCDNAMLSSRVLLVARHARFSNVRRAFYSAESDVSTTPFSLDAFDPREGVLRQSAYCAKRSLGQNFLFDMNITHKMASLAGDQSQSRVVEIGPGPGSLTKALLSRNPYHFTAIEKDARFVAHLQDPERRTLIHGDALQQQGVPTSPDHRPVKIFGNLPFNLASELLVKWVRESHASRAALDMTLMLQREMAERVCSIEGNRERSRLSVIVQNDFDATIAMHVSRAAFTPRPRVDASIVRLVKRPSPCIEIDDFERFSRFLRRLFAMKRKMVRQNLVHRVSAASKQVVLEHFEKVCTSSTASHSTVSTDVTPSPLSPLLLSRPEDLSLTQIRTIYHTWCTLIGHFDEPLG